MTLRQVIIEHALDLQSADGENSEYDRALFELTARLLGISDLDGDEYDKLRRDMTLDCR